MFAHRPSTLAGRLVLAFATLITLMLGLALAGWLAGRGGDPHIGAGLARMHQAIMALGLLGAVAGLGFAASLLRGLRHQQRLLDDAGHFVGQHEQHSLQDHDDRHDQPDEHDRALNTLPGFKALAPKPAAAPARSAQPAAYIVRRPAAGAGSGAPDGIRTDAAQGAGAGQPRETFNTPSTTSGAAAPAGSRPDVRPLEQPETDPAADAELARLQLAVSQLQLSLRDVVRGVRDKAARGGAHATNSTGSTGSTDDSGRPEATRADPASVSSASPASASATDAQAVSGRAARRRLADAGPSLVVDHAVDAAQRSAEVVSQVVGNLEEISAASRRIADTIGVIDAIAFQTNLLALNATVEAARAGEQGSAAAVAAADVRMLAQRAATAAREIRSLIAGTLSRLEGVGQGLADKGHTMQTIVGSVQCVTDIVGHLSQAPVQPAGARGQGAADAAAAAPVPGQFSAEQLSVAQLEQMTRQNTQLVQQSSSAAESLRLQAERLQKVVAAFRLLQQTQQAAWTAHSAIADARRSARLGGPPTAAGAPGAAPLSRPDRANGQNGQGG
jgi:methyl-accepting chemotaxis protein